MVVGRWRAEKQNNACTSVIFWHPPACLMTISHFETKNLQFAYSKYNKVSKHGGGGASNNYKNN